MLAIFLAAAQVAMPSNHSIAHAIKPLAVAPSSHLDVASGARVESTISATGHKNIKVDFGYDIRPLDKTGDQLQYGVVIDGVDTQIGYVAGETGDENDSEVGSRSFDVPVEANDSAVVIYFKNTGNTATDILQITNITASGEEIELSAQPEITLLKPVLWSGADYKGARVDFDVKSVVGLQNIVAKLTRSDGTTVEKTIKQPKIDWINDQDGANASLVVPFVAQALTYSEISDSWWSLPSLTSWTKDSVPESVTVELIFADNVVSKTAPIDTASLDYLSLLSTDDRPIQSKDPASSPPELAKPAPLQPKVVKTSAPLANHSLPVSALKSTAPAVKPATAASANPASPSTSLAASSATATPLVASAPSSAGVGVEPTKNKAANPKANVATKSQPKAVATDCGKLLGVCWYWGIPVVAGAGGIAWIYLALRSRVDEEATAALFEDRPPRRR